jgi:hypothetical protein
MADFKTNGRSIYDMAKNLDANGNAIKTAEVLMKTCNILKDAPVKKANNILTHKETLRTSLPSAEVKRLNQGVGGAFPSRDNIEFGLKNYQSLPWIDKMEFQYAKNPDEIRQDNMEGILMGWGQSMNADFIYDNVAANGSESINGIAYYCKTLDGNRVVSAGGDSYASKLTSIYVVGWDLIAGAYAIIPEKANAGINFEVLGDSVITDPSDSTKRILVENYKVEAALGLGTRDTRAFARVANIDVTTVDDTTFDPAWLMTVLSELPVQLQNKTSTVIYVPKEVMLAIQLAANSKTNASFVYKQTELFAEPVMTFNGYPIRLDESISTAEDVVA